MPCRPSRVRKVDSVLGEGIMNSRERVHLAIRRRQPDRLPKGFFADPGTMRRLREFFSTEDDETVLDALGIDLRHVEPVFVGPAERSGGLQHTDRVRPDFWGVPRKLVTNAFGTYSEIAGHPLGDAKTVAEIENYAWPKQEWFDTSTMGEQLARANARGPRFINYHRAGKLFEICWALRGMEQVLIDMLESPEIVRALLEKILDFYCTLAKRVVQAGGGRIDLATIGDDFGTQRSMIMSPANWQETFKPYLREMIRALHDLGVSVMYHSCGAIVPIIEGLIEVGVDILEPIQTSAEGMDPAFLKKAFGDRLSFHGGVDEQDLLPFGSPERVRTEVEQLGRVLGRGGGYILMAAHALQGDIPCENVLAMYEAAETC